MLGRIMIKKIKTSKAFIQIPLLIAIVVFTIVSSATTGIVLYKQGRLSKITASVSSIFQKSEKDISVFDSSIREESNVIQEDAEEHKENAEQRDESKKELEQAKREAEKARQEAEIARRETEVLRKQQEETRKQEELRQQKILREQEEQEELEQKLARLQEEKRKLNEESQDSPVVCASGLVLCNNKCWKPCKNGQFHCPNSGDAKCIREDDIELNIEKCKALVQLKIDKMKVKMDEMRLKGEDALKNWKNAILDSEIHYSKCMYEPLPDDIIKLQLSPSQIIEFRESQCNHYLDSKARLEKDLEQKEKELDEIIQQIETKLQQEYSKFYLDCLNAF